MPSLILVAFLVVLVAQVVSWIGESVLSEFVSHHPHAVAVVRALTGTQMAGIFDVSRSDEEVPRAQTKRAQDRHSENQARASANERTRPVRQVGEAETECG